MKGYHDRTEKSCNCFLLGSFYTDGNTPIAMRLLLGLARGCGGAIVRAAIFSKRTFISSVTPPVRIPSPDGIISIKHCVSQADVSVKVNLVSKHLRFLCYLGSIRRILVLVSCSLCWSSRLSVFTFHFLWERSLRQLIPLGTCDCQRNFGLARLRTDRNLRQYLITLGVFAADLVIFWATQNLAMWLPT